MPLPARYPYPASLISPHTHTPTRKIITIDVSARRDCTGTRRLATILHRASPIISKFESGDLNCIDLTGTTPKKTKPRKRKPNTHRAVSVSLKKTARPKCDVRDGITTVKNGCPDQQGHLQCVGDALAHRVHASPSCSTPTPTGGGKTRRLSGGAKSSTRRGAKATTTAIPMLTGFNLWTH